MTGIFMSLVEVLTSLKEIEKKFY